MITKLKSRLDRFFKAFLGLMAWVVFVVAVVGGLTATGTFVVKIVDFFVGILGWIIGIFIPGDAWWLPYPLIVLGAIFVVCDIAKEGVPERYAVYIPMAWPSLFLAIPKDAKLYTTLTGWIDSLNGWLDTNIGPWVGGDTNQQALMTVVSVCCIAAAVLFVERYRKDLGKMGGGAAPAAPAAGRPPVAARRAR